MSIPTEIANAITRLVKPEGTKLSTRETIEAHADKICSTHNEMLKAMLHYLDTGEVSNRRIQDWAREFGRDNASDVELMRGVLNKAILEAPKFEGLSDAAALEAYGRLLLNLYSMEITGQGRIA